MTTDVGRVVSIPPLVASLILDAKLEPLEDTALAVDLRDVYE